MSDNSEMPELWWPKKELVQLKDPIGFAWHKGFDALTKSTQSGCPICGLVQAGVQIWLDHYREAEKSESFLEFQKDFEPIPSEERLWLAKRIGGGDGFIVLARNPTSNYRVYFLTAVNFSVEAGSKLASKFPLRPVQRDSGSQQSLHSAASLVRNCVENHEQCTREDTPLPSRVLDVGSAGDTIKLINCPGSLRGKYISLSHCRSSSDILTTTQESYEIRISGISLSHLPNTYFDAVIIARYLGIRYVWMDSLCIMQEDQNDWARESARMAQVYSNAYLVIAANHARDVSKGCFHERPIRPKSKVNFPGIGEICMQLLYPGDKTQFKGLNFEDEALSQRGWALQERILAKCILHYNDRQICLECNHGVMGEDGSRFDRRYCCNLSDLKENKEPQHQEASKPERSPEHTMWNGLLWAYGTRKLTKATDKLPAMSGLAKLFKSRIGAQYVAGIWSDRLIEGLAWQGIGNRAPASTTEYTGPSWSWVSYDGIAATGLRGECNDISKIEDWHVEPQNVENPFGEVKNAWIRVHGPLTELKPSGKDITDHEKRLMKIGTTPLPRLRTRYSDNEEGQIVSPDNDEIRNSGDWRSIDMLVMILCRRSDESKESEMLTQKVANQDSKSLCYGLVVTRVGDGQDLRMKRVGWMFLEGEEADKIIEDKECWKTVTLV